MQPSGVKSPELVPDLMHGSQMLRARDVPACTSSTAADVVVVSNAHTGGNHVPKYPAQALGTSVIMQHHQPPAHGKVYEPDPEPEPEGTKAAGKEDKKEAKPKLPPVPLTQLWRFSSKGDKLLLLGGIFCGCIVGAVLPLFTLVFGALIDILNDRASTIQSQADEIQKLCLYFVYIAIASGIAAFVESTAPVYVAERCLRTLRHEYMRSLLRQDMAWHDTNRAGEATARLAEATLAMSTGMEKFSTAIKSFCTLIVGIIIGFTTSWKLTLVIMGCAPFFAISLAVLIISITTTEAKSIKAYARAGDVANEVFSQIRTVAAYNGEEHEVSRYDLFLARAEQAGIDKGKATGFSVGILLFSFYAMYGISTYAGAEFVLMSRKDDPQCAFDLKRQGCFTGGKVVQTFIAVLLGAVSFGSVGPIIGNVVAARAAAAELYQIIDAEPEVDMDKPGGHKGVIKGKIEFINCTFAYPSRPDQIVLRNFSLTIEPGQTVALVGPSGSGKSTIIGLLERFYELREGKVLVDGIETRDWDLRSLREQIGLVQQDPLLFGIPICDNIAMGLPTHKGMKGGELSAEVMQMVQDASTAANAHGFISKLPKGYRTPAGTSVSSTQLSGGQRQRVCIARSIIRKPRVLLLDEATSALDTESERIVQASLDSILSEGGALGRGVTTIMIAHRLSTVTNADKIIVLDRGVIAEQGSHKELMERDKGLYRAMRQVQDLAHADESASVLGEVDSGAGDQNKTLSFDGLNAHMERAASVDDGKSQEKGNAEAQMIAEAKELPYVSIMKIFRTQRPEWPLFAVGFIAAMCGGAIQPIFAIIYSGIITVFFLPNDDEMRTQAKEFLGWFFALGIAAFFTVLLRISLFTYVGEKLTRRLRIESFRSSLRQDMSYYDDTKNSVGRLATRLATDATLVKGMTGDGLGSVLEGCSALVAALVIAYTASWRLALVLTAVFPLLIAGAVFEFKSISQQTGSSNKELEVSGEIVSDAITAIRTVTAFNLQGDIIDLFDDSLELPEKTGKRRGMIQGIGSGFKQFVSMNSYALAFYAGSRFMSDGVLGFDMLIRVFLAITLASEGIGRITSQAPDTAKAQSAARSVYHQIDIAADGTAIDPMDDAKGLVPNGPINGKIEFKNVWFAYPQRPDIKVLKNFSAVIMPGQTVALVGESGSGKSTIMQLVQRLYNPSEGEIFLDDLPISSYNVSWLRSMFGMVQQEPALFADSILYNIGYGTQSKTKPQPGMGAPVAQVDEEDETDKKKKGKKGKKEEDALAVLDPTAWTQPTEKETSAARDANASGFIETLQNRYATHVGSRGSQLSGGQKQRVAIARAVLRNPPILLLDEATSALDSKSEQLVQEALDRLLAGAKRTTFVIAHRLSTIQKADRIIVLERGTVIEDGSHDQLVSKPNGAYRKLAMAQSAARH